MFAQVCPVDNAFSTIKTMANITITYIHFAINNFYNFIHIQIKNNRQEHIALSFQGLNPLQGSLIT